MEPTELKTLVEETHKAFADFKTVNEDRIKALETGHTGHAKEYDAKLEKINKELEAKEAKYTELQKKLEDEAKRFDTMEATFNRMGAGGLGGAALERKNFLSDALFEFAQKNHTDVKERKVAWLNQVVRGSQPMEQKVLTLRDPESGGYLSIPEMANELIKNAVEYTDVMGLCNTSFSGKLTWRAPRRTGIITATREGENATETEDTGTKYAAVSISLPKIRCLVLISEEDLMDTDFDLEGDISEQLRMAFSVKIGTEFYSGAGSPSNQLEGLSFYTGFLTAYDESSYPYGYTATGLTGTDLATMNANVIYDLIKSLMPTYHGGARFVMKASTLFQLRKLVNGVGNYIFAEFTAATPMSIAGFPVTIAQQMPSVSSNVYPIAFGDFKRGYYVRVRTAMTMQRLIEKYIDQGAIGLRCVQWIGGKVVQPEAIRLLKQAAS